MRIFKVILGVILILVSINVMITMSGEEQGAGLAGAVTGFVIFVGLGAWLLYSASVKPKDNNRDEYSSVSTKESLNIKDNYEGKITLLNELRRKDILTEDEYKEKVENLRKAQLEIELRASDDYRKLKSLFDDNILTKEEFEQKLEILSKRPPIVNSTSYISEPIININHSSTKVVLGIIILIIGVFFLGVCKINCVILN